MMNKRSHLEKTGIKTIAEALRDVPENKRTLDIRIDTLNPQYSKMDARQLELAMNSLAKDIAELAGVPVTYYTSVGQHALFHINKVIFTIE